MGSRLHFRGNGTFLRWTKDYCVTPVNEWGRAAAHRRPTEIALRSHTIGAERDAGRAVDREEGVGHDLAGLAAGDVAARAIVWAALRVARLDQARAGVGEAGAAVIAADDAPPRQPLDVEVERIA